MGATGLEGFISSLTAGAAQLIMLRNGSQKKKKRNVRYSLNEISQDVKTPAGLAALNQDRRGFINSLFCLSPCVNAGIFRANVEQFIQQL